ncbi:MAG: hypothetical protein ABI999_11855 [Acidobacteriota bacterium]
MITRKKSYLIVFVFVVLAIGTLGVIGISSRPVTTRDLSFAVRTDKEAFTLGEPIQIEWVLTNNGTEAIRVPAQGVESGSLKIYIAGEDGEYKEYFGSGWGRKRGTAVTLEPGKSQSYFATILWNGKPDVSHLNETAAIQVLAGKITTEYALPKPGVYFIKGVSSISQGNSEYGFKPTRIVVNQPTGDDLEVWNQIKGNGEIALLMQDGTFYTDKDETKRQLTDQVEQIATRYPQSIYSSYLKTNLEKYKAHEAQRNEFYKSMKVGQKPQ